MKISTTPLALAAMLLAAALPVAAQYKVVGPDGRVTYTDRPPTASEGKVAPLGRSATSSADAAVPAGGDPSLPLDVRQAAAKYPVVLYASNDCEPCDLGRRLLKQRGIPFREQTLATEEDAEAMTRLTGGRVVPTLTVGTQTIRGLAESDWQAYLDAAGYPRESRLPRNYAAPAAKPLTERKLAVRPPARPASAVPEAPTAEAEPAPPPTSAGTGGIRF
jgi:glutaredoxin